jgi:predicted secreted protein
MAGIDAFGTQWQIHDGVSSYDAVAEVTNIDLLDVDVEDLDVTSHDSPEEWREFIGGLKDGGELSFEINFDPAVHAELLDLLGVTRDHKLVLPAAADDAEVDFQGHISSLSAAAPHDDKLSATASVKVSGKPTITIPS